MKSLKSLAIALVMVFALTASGQTAQKAKPSADELLERPLPGSQIEYLSTTDAFYISLGGVGMPGGAAWTLGCEQDNSTQVWIPLNKTLRQALDTIVERDTRYRWEMVDGTVNLLPATGEPALLQTRINDFHVENTVSAIAALGPLLALPEVKKAMNDLHLKPGIAVFISPGSPKPFSVACKGVTLRQALNAIARAQGRAVWDYIEIHCQDRNEVVIRF